MCGIQIMGLPEQPIEGVRLDNVRLISKGSGTKKDAASNPEELGVDYPEPGKLGTLPAYGIFARHVKDLELANLTTRFQKTELRPAAVFADIDGLEIDNFKPQVSAGVGATVISQDVRDVIIYNSPILEPK